MKIVEVKSLGLQQTYSPEMASKQHNYITASSNAIHKNSHSVAYSLVAYRCLYLKTYYPSEWWATVMSRCDRKKLTRFMEVARSENVKFGIFDPNHLTDGFVVLKNDKGEDYVSPGLLGVKGVKSKAQQYAGIGNYQNIDEFIEAKGKHKTTMERLIKLGTFTRFKGHENIKATWMWYQYQYSKDSKIRADIKELLLTRQNWNDQTIKEEIERQAKEFKLLYPKRKIPTKILNWKPKPDDSRDNILALYKDDYSIKELLEFEKEYLGYYLRSPLDMYKLNGLTIANAKKTYKNAGDDKTILFIECVVQNAYIGQTKEKKQPFARLVCTDGKATISVFCWNTELDDVVARWYKADVGVDLGDYIDALIKQHRPIEDIYNEISLIYDKYIKYITEKGVKLSVVYNQERSTYSIARMFDKNKGSQIQLLELKDDNVQPV